MPEAIERLVVTSGEVAYITLGEGPALLVPWCNLPWPDLPVIERLTAQFRVVLASPIGYQESSRRAENEEYRAAGAIGDLLAACDALHLDRFAVFGYSLSAAMAAWLAGTSSRVTRAVLGGFPLLGSYQLVYEGARADSQKLQGDPGFDTRAALGFYRDLAARADGALVDDCQCPIRAFWGADDEVLERFNTEPNVSDALSRRGVMTTIVEDADHLSTILAADAVMQAIEGTAR